MVTYTFPSIILYVLPLDYINLLFIVKPKIIVLFSQIAFSLVYIID